MSGVHLIPHLEHNCDSKNTILLIHGAGSSPAEFVPLFPFIPDNYHLLVPSLRSISPFSLDSAVTEIYKLIRAKARQPRIHVVGHSLGSHIALAFADSYPDMIESLMVCGYHRLDSESRLTNKLIVNAAVVSEKLFKDLSPGLRKRLVDIEPEVYQQVVNAQRTWPTEEITLERGYEYLTALSETENAPYWTAKGAPRVLVIAATKGNILLPTNDSLDSARKLGQAMRGARAHDDAANVMVVQHNKMRHQWTLQAPELFASTMISWINGEPLDKGFDALEFLEL